jgi:hypothetical protein
LATYSCPLATFLQITTLEIFLSGEGKIEPPPEVDRHFRTFNDESILNEYMPLIEFVLSKLFKNHKDGMQNLLSTTYIMRMFVLGNLEFMDFYIESRRGMNPYERIEGRDQERRPLAFLKSFTTCVGGCTSWERGRIYIPYIL